MLGLQNLHLVIKNFRRSVGLLASPIIKIVMLTAIAAGVSRGDQLVGGDGFTLALKADGTVMAWGDNAWGQLGDGTNINRQSPVPVSGLSNVKDLSLFSGRPLALLNDGQVKTWGGASGMVPVGVAGLANVKQISAGGSHALALCTNGEVWAWGSNDDGQLGDGTRTDSSVPVLIAGLNDVESVHAGRFHSMAVKSDGTVMSWGDNSDNQLGYGALAYSASPILVPGLTNVETVALGWEHSLALHKDGTVSGWGRNAYGELGDGTKTSRSAHALIPGLTGVEKIRANFGHSMALKSDGTVWIWGKNLVGHMGGGIMKNERLSPVLVAGLGNIEEIAAADMHSLALASDGKVWGWGWGARGELADASVTERGLATQIASIGEVISVSTGSTHVAALRKDGTVWTWGRNTYGQLGVKNVEMRAEPGIVDDCYDIIAISAGHSYTAALRRDGTVWSWGDNGVGELGDGTTEHRMWPVAASGLIGVKAIAAGGGHTLALAENGTVWSWGYNWYGAIGNGTRVNQVTPFQINGLPSIKAISAGRTHSMALDEDGNVWVWGGNYASQMGDGGVVIGPPPQRLRTNEYRIVPGMVAGLSNVKAISAGDDHSLVLKEDGTVIGWGGNQYGQVGVAASVSVKFPTATGITGVAGIFTSKTGSNSYDGRFHFTSMAVLNDHRVVGWGSNSYGQLGNGTVTDTHIPVDMLDVKVGEQSQLSPGRANFVLKNDGGLLAVGNGAVGDFGNGMAATSPVPRMALGFHRTQPTPTVSITAPAYDTSVNLFGKVTVQTSAAVSSGSIDRVFFYADGIYLGEDETAPYTYTYNPKTWGNIELHAIAASSAGAYSKPSNYLRLKTPYDGNSNGLGDWEEATAWWEGYVGEGNPMDMDADGDNDGINNLQEFNLKTSPVHPDTDLDGIPDNLDTLPLTSATVADPDGAGLASSLAYSLRGFWDFESIQPGAGPPPYLPPYTFPDKSGSNRHATSAVFGPSLPGMPSKSGDIGVSTITLPTSAVQGQNNWSISGWFRLKEGTIQGFSNGVHRSLYALYDRTSDSAGGVRLGKGNGLFVRKHPNGGELWTIGGYEQTTYFNEYPNINGNPKSIFFGTDFVLPAGTSDDGRWHHFAVTRGTGSFGQIVYMDGLPVLTTIVKENTVAYDGGTYPTTLTLGRLYPSHDSVFGSDAANIDRVRIHGRVLSEDEVEDYYQQDIDQDGLWDITEVNTELWRDQNSDGFMQETEIHYISNPYQWQFVDADTDGDGLTDVEEQTLGTDPGSADSDGDLLPDGWEVEHGLNPLDATGVNGGDGDGDLDGEDNLSEYSYNTDPNNASSGGPPAIPPAEQMIVLLGVGDESGSKSEDYVLNCFEINPETGAEQRVYTLRSGGPGQYEEKTPPVFQKGRTYTFQIQWQGTNNNTKNTNPKEGPDFDYTLKIEPQEDHSAILIDSYDPKTKSIDETKKLIAEDASDVAQTKQEFDKEYGNKRVVLLAVETVVGEPGTPDESVGDWVVAEAWPKPSVAMTVTGTQLVGADLHVTVHGSVRDPISRFASGSSERPQTLQFFQDGQLRHSIPIGSSVGDGFAFNETIVIPDAKPVSYMIRAETTANVAGLKGSDQSAVSLTWREDASAYPALSSNLSAYFPAAPTTGVVDQAVVYVGNGAPPVGSGVFTETAASSDTYAGQFVIPASPASLTGTGEFRFTRPHTFSGITPDSIIVEFRYTAPNYPQNVVYGRWLETGANTRIFRPYGWSFGDQRLQEAYTANLPESEASSIEPVTLRFPVLPGQANDPGDLRIIAGSTTYNLLRIGGFWYPKDPQQSGSPKLFLPSSLPVPQRLTAPGYDAAAGKLAFKLKLNANSEIEGPEVSVLPGMPEEPAGGMSGLGGMMSLMSGGEPWAPGQPVQLHQLIWAYNLVHADDTFALELLNGYLRGGHLIEMHDGEDLDLDVTLNDLITDTDNIWTIQIEEDWNPIYCARLLFEGLKQASVYAEVYNHYEFQESFDDILAFKTACDTAVANTRETAVFATQLYLSGFGIVNEGADWILIINDVSEGNYTSLAGALPFIPAGIVQNGGRLIIRRGGDVVDTLDGAAVEALRDVARNGDFNAAGALYDEYGFSEHLRKALSGDTGPIKAPTRRGTLRDRLARDFPKPGPEYVVHHDFPWEMRGWFAEHGIDVNDSAFGRWAHKDDHDLWHQGAGGGAFNDWWAAVREQERNSGIQLTKAQLLVKSLEARQIFPSTK